MGVLYIRSQNKKTIAKVESIDCFDKYEGNPNNFNGYEGQKYVGSYIEVNGKAFATYSSKERAIEVLDEICNALTGKITAQTKQSSKAKEKVGTVGENDSVELKTLNCDAVYQMPQE